MSEIVHGGEAENRQLRLNLIQRKYVQRFIFGNNINCCPEITAQPLRKTQASLCVTVAQSQTAHVFDFSYSKLYDKKKIQKNKISHKKCTVYDSVCLLITLSSLCSCGTHSTYINV